MRRLNAVDWVALVLLVIGGLNWLLVGLFGFNVVAFLFGPFTLISRIIYVLVGIAGIYVAVDAFTFVKRPAGMMARPTGA